MQSLQDELQEIDLGFMYHDIIMVRVCARALMAARSLAGGWSVWVGRKGGGGVGRDTLIRAMVSPLCV